MSSDSLLSGRKHDRDSDSDELPASKRKKRLESVDLGTEDSQTQRERGSIVRISLQNFVTYTTAELRPSPQLNVIVGPNGSGKSSLVCAMVLGLGGKPAFLGRAKDAADYIKAGCDHAVIEIELYTGQGKNKVVRRDIYKDNSTWKIDGKPVRLKDIENLVRDFNIQVENLCSFLPQDRVVSFAALDSASLLKETERAVGGDKFLEEHNKLIELKSKERGVTHRFEELQKHLEELKEQNSALERDVQRFQMRERQLEKVRWLKKKKPWVEFELKRLETLEAKEELQKAVERYQKFQEECGPVLAKISEKTKEMSNLDKTIADHLLSLKKIDTQRANKMTKFDSLVEEAESIELQKQQLEERRENREKERDRLRKMLETALNSLKEQENMQSEYAKELEVLKKRHKAASQLRNDKAMISAEKREALKSLQAEIEKVKRVLASYNSTTQMRLYALQQQYRDAYEAYQWIQSQRGSFKGKVLGPLVLELNVPNKQHASYLEQSLAAYVKKSIVFTDRDDLQRFDKVAKEREWKLTMLLTGKPEEKRHPIPIEELKQFGIECYLDETFDADPIVKYELCNVNSIHTMVAGTKETIAARGNLLRFLSKEAVEKGYSHLTAFFTPESQYSTTVSKYTKDLSTSVRPVRPATLLAGINMTEKLEHENKLKELTAKARELEEELNELKAEEDKAQAEVLDIERQINEKEKQKKQVEAWRRKVKSLQNDLEELEKEEDIEDEFAKLDQKRMDNLETRFREVGTLRKVTSSFIAATREYASLVVHRCVLKQELAKLREETENSNAQLEMLKKEAENAKTQFELLKRELANKKKMAEEATPMTDEVRAKFDELPNDLEEIDNLIHECQSRADSYITDPTIIKQYEARKVEIADLEKKLKQEEEDITELRNRIAQLRSVWLPKVENMVSAIDKNFSKFFKRINCTGEVRLKTDPNDDFDKFGIEICVSYRANQPVQPLNVHVQSGGERSVATMLYLISLQTISDSPFRLVDEINQGMDPVNERMIFNQIREQASLPGTPQYFLITPKLIPGLNFTKEVTVHCVLNGPWQIPQENWPMLN